MKLLALVFTMSMAVLATARAQDAAVNTSAQNIVGSWKLVAYEDRLADGSVEYPFGRKPVGLLIYDATGHMAIQIMKVPHPKVASGDDEKVTAEEKPALFDSYEAYFGTYSIDSTKKEVTHHVEGHLYDVYVGTSQKRPFELSGDRLTLTPHWERDGRPVQGIRVFERIK